MIIPNHIQIETIKGICTAKCVMCPIDSWELEPLIMTYDSFCKIMDKISDHKEVVRYLTLHGRGEPLLDKGLCEKIKYAKHCLHHETSIGFASNCTDLSINTSKDLIQSGLSLIICSVDGVSKDVHESIRIGTNYEQIVENIKNFIQLRNESNADTRVMLRFIYQEKNHEEWEDYQLYWNELINPNKGDLVVKFDVHNWGGQDSDISSIDTAFLENIKEPIICDDLYNRFIIQCDGEIGFCCALEDDKNNLNLGNIFENTLSEIYNQGMFIKYRKEMEKGRIFDLELCKNCTIPISRYKKGIL